MEPLILCVNMEKGRLMRFSFLAMAWGVRVRAVDDRELGQTLAALCGLEPMRENAPSIRIKDEMMVMAFFPDGLIDQWLLAMRKSGLPPVRLKAVLTPTNRAWTCGQLHAMLSQEAAFFAKKEKRP